MRASGRASDEMREVRLTRAYTCHAEGSALVEFGRTHEMQRLIGRSLRSVVNLAATARTGIDRLFAIQAAALNE